MTEEELLALVAARGLLHRDDQAMPATRGTARSLDGLAGSIHHLIERTGLIETAQRAGRHLVSVSRFGAAPIANDVLTTCLSAAASNQAITFAYNNLEGVTSQPTAVPQRLVLIRGEWYCVAWAGMLRMFRLARMAAVTITTKRPKGTPANIPSQEVDDLLAQSFYATGSSDPQRRCRVVLAVRPGAWPFIQGRTWGSSQRVDEAPVDLPQGWRRLSFVTTGLAECRHWMLGIGSGVRAEQPTELVDWMRVEAEAMATLYTGLA